MPTTAKSRANLATQMRVIGPDEVDVIESFEQNQRIIAVVGFSGSGKTFLVNRLRNDLRTLPWRVAPGPAEEIHPSPAGLELTRLVPFKQRSGQSLSYVLTDLSGESFRQALSPYQRDESSGFSTHSYLASIAFASAYILLIRLEDVQEVIKGTSSQSAREVRILLNSFHDILSSIIICSERLMREHPEDFLRIGISSIELQSAFTRVLKCDKPICILFTQADRTGVPKSENGSDIDPLMFAQTHLPGLYHQIHNTFRHYRFDFVSAFQEHSTDSKVNYRLPSHGALEAFLWLHDLFDRDHSVLGRLKRISREWLSRLVQGEPLPDSSTQRPHTWKTWPLALPRRIDTLPPAEALGLGAAVGVISAVLLLRLAPPATAITAFLLLLVLGVGFALTGEPVLTEEPAPDSEPPESTFDEGWAKTQPQVPAPTPRSNTK